ncbi:MAG: hypothetical protein JSV46_09990 [Candidatus Aminicenantes bacterium]|nr:MAG: hypothetical protein JSV46_09990 [Candidatus Aminicenantes bacterium]
MIKKMFLNQEESRLRAGWRVFNLISFQLILFISVMYGNFAGFESAKLGAFGTTLNVLKNNVIIFEKERLYFKLDQRVNFKGIYFFKNPSPEDQTLTFAFPQESYWEVPYNDDLSKYLPAEYYPFYALIKVNGEVKQDITEKISLRVEDLKKQIKFYSAQEMTQTLIDYANYHEAENPPKMPILIWKLFNHTIPAGSQLEIEVDFKLPWFYADEIWSDNIRTDGTRFFEYITSTAATWANGEINDFEAKVEFPVDVNDNLKLYPIEWQKTESGVAVLKKKNFKPSANDHIKFIWSSDYFLEIPSSVKFFKSDDEEDFKKARTISSACWEYLYYKDYNWRFLSDHSSETAWSINPNGLMCPAYRIIPVLNSERLSENLKNILPFKNWVYENEVLNNVPKIASKLMIISGFAKNERLFKANSRPKEIIFFFKTYKNEWSELIELKDDPSKQIFNLKFPIDIKDSSISFKIKSIYKGIKYSDICISEISFIE